MADLEVLAGRCVIRMSGADASSFLQNLLTNDVMNLKWGHMVYACLLNPQGRILHDMFVLKESGGFLLECEAARQDDLLRRLSLYKLRSDVTFEKTPLKVCVGETGFPDPRLPALGFRSYRTEAPAALSESCRDRRIALGVPEGSAEIRPEVDTPAHLNLDFLNAISWSKGCYVGQEVTAMTENRGQAKKRMAIVTGQSIALGDIMHGDQRVGEVRSVNSAATQGLAVIKIAYMNQGLTGQRGTVLQTVLPSFVDITKT